MNATYDHTLSVPIWGMILIGIGSAFLSLCMLFCILKYVTRMRRKKKKKPDKLGLANSDYLGLFYNERVGEGLNVEDYNGSWSHKPYCDGNKLVS